MMNRYIKWLSQAFSVCLSISLFGCSDDIPAELTSLQTSRLFSVTNLDARVVNQTQVRLNFKAVKDAESYVVEFFEGENTDFVGTPALAIADITMDQLPYVVERGLAGETTYTVRVKAVGQGIGDSKWMTAVVTTLPEQIFRPINIEDLWATQVILRWEEGETVTHITLEPGRITRELTTQEVAAGEATITGLSAETTYSAVLMNNDKVRGRLSFTTTLDLNGANVIVVPVGGDLVAAIANAPAGTTLALQEGVFEVGTTITVDKSITLRATRPADRATIQGAVFRPTAGASLTLADLDIDGAQTSNPVVNYNATGVFAQLKVENCKVFNYQRGLAYSNTAGVDLQQIEVKNSVFHDMAHASTEFVDFRASTILRTLTFEDNTVYNVADAGKGLRDFIRIDNSNNDFAGEPIIVTVTNNTLYNVAGDGRRIMYVRRAPHTVDFSRNLVVNTEALITATGNNATTFTTMANNNFYATPNITVTGTNTAYNPGFADPASGDFTVSHEELRLNQIGARRWIQ